MTEEQLRHLCQKLPSEVEPPSPPLLAFSLEGAHRQQLDLSPAGPGNGDLPTRDRSICHDFQFGTARIQGQLLQQDQNLILTVASDRPFEEGTAVWFALGSETREPWVAAIRLQAAQGGGSQGRSDLGPLDEIRRLYGPFVQLAVFPPRLPSGPVSAPADTLRLLLEELRLAKGERAVVDALNAIIAQVEEQLRRNLQQALAQCDWISLGLEAVRQEDAAARIEEALEETWAALGRFRLDEPPQDAFGFLLGLAIRHLAEVVQHRSAVHQTASIRTAAAAAKTQGAEPVLSQEAGKVLKQCRSES